MTNLDEDPGRRLDTALNRLATTFRGMAAHPDAINCTCHWGSAADLARLKTPDVRLDPGLLERTWRAYWDDQPAILRRILPQFAAALVAGAIDDRSDLEDAGHCFAKGRWQQWPAEQAGAVWEFLDAWWAGTLSSPEPTVPAYDVLVLIAEASGSLGRWLAAWGAQTHPVADGHLAEAVAHWEYDLLGERLPWHAWENEEEMCAELTAWVVRHAPVRLRAHGVPEELLHRIRLLGLTGPARWDDPHWPGHTYWVPAVEP